MQGTTYWTDLFVRHFLFQAELSIDCDDLLFFVRKKHIKGSSRFLPKFEVRNILIYWFCFRKTRLTSCWFLTFCDSRKNIINTFLMSQLNWLPQIIEKLSKLCCKCRCKLLLLDCAMWPNQYDSIWFNIRYLKLIFYFIYLNEKVKWLKGAFLY